MCRLSVAPTFEGVRATDGLRGSLRELLDSGADNAALDRLLADYARYHLVLVVVGGLFAAAVAGLAVFCGRRYAAARRQRDAVAAFERRTYLGFGLLALAVVLFLGVVLAGNVSNVRDPRRGFLGALGLLGVSRPGSARARLHESFEGWLHAGGGPLPSPVRHAVADRLSWQQPKALVCIVLLGVSVTLAGYAWRSLVRGTRPRGAETPRRRPVLLLVALSAVPVCLLLMLMVLGNTQASLAPLAITLFYG